MPQSFPASAMQKVVSGRGQDLQAATNGITEQTEEARRVVGEAEHALRSADSTMEKLNQATSQIADLQQAASEAGALINSISDMEQSVRPFFDAVEQGLEARRAEIQAEKAVA